MAGSNQDSRAESFKLEEEDTVMQAEAPRKEMPKKRPKIFPFPGLGMLCALLTALCYSLNTLLVKLVDGLHPVQLSLSRTYVQFLILLPLLQYKRKEVDILGPEGSRIYLWLRGLAGSTAMIFLYLAVNAMSMGNAVTIAYISMILVPFMARIFLKESLTVLDIVFAIASLVGVVLIAQPTFLFPVSDGQQPPTNAVGVVYALGSAILQAVSLICIRKLGKGTYPALNVLYYAICGGVTTTILLSSIEEWRLPCWHDLPYIFLLGIIGVVGQYMLTVALQYERAGTVGVLRSTQIIMVYLLQVTILGDIPTMFSVIGAALIFSSAAGIGIRKLVNERNRRKAAKENS